MATTGGFTSLLSRFINLKMGLIGAVVMGSIVFVINAEFGWTSALIAGLKQAGYTFFIGGIIIKLCETLATQFATPSLSVALACIVPSVIATILVYSIHSMKGTPLPLESTLPTIVLSIPGFLFIGLRKRKASLDRM